jgi:hypothetical protein
MHTHKAGKRTRARMMKGTRARMKRRTRARMMKRTRARMIWRESRLVGRRSWRLRSGGAERKGGG